MAAFWINFNVILFSIVCVVALARNCNFNTVMVGLTYLAPLIPVGLTAANADRFLIVSFSNMIFGSIEVVVFVITVKPGDAAFDKEHMKQLLGHVLPIVAALVGMSFVSRATSIPVGKWELMAIVFLFVIGSVMRVAAIAQLGALGFKFDITFREKQTLKTTQLYQWMRHPSYTAMMLVIFSYALTTHSWVAGGLGMVSAWFGFQYRIHHEEKALAQQFGDDYLAYRAKTGMWLPIPGKRLLS